MCYLSTRCSKSPRELFPPSLLKESVFSLTFEEIEFLLSFGRSSCLKQYIFLNITDIKIQVYKIDDKIDNKIKYFTIYQDFNLYIINNK